MLFYQFVHSSEPMLGDRKTFTAFTLQVYTHFFSKTGYDQWILSKKSCKLSLFTCMLFFWLDNFLFLLLFFFFLLFLFLLALFSFSSFPFLSYLPFAHFLSLLSFFSFSLWKGCANKDAHYLLTSNHKVNEKRTKMVSRKNGDEITEDHNAKNF